VTALDLPHRVLEGHGVRLEPYRDEHLAGLTEALGTAAVFAGGWGGGPAGTRTGAEFAAWLPTYLPIGRGNPYVVHNEAGIIIGTSSIGDIVPATESAHIGWTAYAPEVWGTSVNPACKLLLLSHLFDHGYGRVKLQADVLNDRSRAGIEKLGAQFEGITRRDQQRADGSWRDAAVYSITIDDWPRVREGLLTRLG